MIPKKFTLGAIEYTVKVVPHINNRVMGDCSIVDKTILLAENSISRKTSEIGMEQTLYHEVVHSILDEIGRDDLSSDETFVQSFSLLLHQFEKTKE